MTTLSLPKTTESTRKRSLALANLRGFAIVMVLSFHSFIAYNSTQPAAALPFDDPPYLWMVNPIVDRARWVGFDLFCAFQYSYLMHMMFFLSGMFVWPSLAGKRSWGFLQGRLIRLGVPWVLGVYLLMPIAYYPVYLTTATDPAWSAFWSHWMGLNFWPSGPLWFLGVLWAFNVIAALLHRFIPGAGEFLARLADGSRDRPARFFVGLVAASALVYVPLAQFYKPWDWINLGPLAFQPSFVLPYAVFFFAGAGVGALGLEKTLVSPDGALARRWAVWLAATPFAFAAWLAPTAMIFNGHTFPGLQIMADIGLALTSATSSFGLIAVFARFASGRSPILGKLSENAYAIYLVHYVFVIWLQFALLDSGLLSFAKAAIVLAGTLILSYAAAKALFLGTRLGRRERQVAKVQ